MRKYEGYEQAEAFTGEYEKLTPGGYICRIMKVAVEDKNYGHLMRIAFDIAEGEHEGYYARLYDRKANTSSDAKWPGVYYQTVKADNLEYFKGFMTAIEQSNPGFKWGWNEEKLVGKFFGGVFGEEEYQANDGSIKTSVKCRYVRSVEQIKKGVNIPEIKRLDNNQFMQPSNIPDKDIPFL